MAASKKPSRNMWVWRPNEHVSIFHGTYKVSLLDTTNYLNVTAKVIRSMDMPCTEIWLGIIFNFAQSAINVQQYYSIDDIWYQDILVKLKITILWTISFKIVHLVPTETDAGNAGWKGIHNKSLKVYNSQLMVFMEEMIVGLIHSIKDAGPPFSLILGKKKNREGGFGYL